MPISFSTLWSDSFNFIRNTFANVIVLLCVITGLNLLVMLFLQSDIQFIMKFMEQLTSLLSEGQTSLDQVQTKISQYPPEMLQQVTGSALSILFAQLIKGLISISLMFAFIHTVSISQFSLNNLLQSTSRLFVQLGLSFVLLIPIFFVAFSLGALLGILGVFIAYAALLVAFALLPAILMANKSLVLSAIRLSYRAGFSQFRVMLPLVATYLMISNFVTFRLAGWSTNQWADTLIIFISQIIAFFFAICCYRLWTMISDQKATQETL